RRKDRAPRLERRLWVPLQAFIGRERDRAAPRDASGDSGPRVMARVFRDTLAVLDPQPESSICRPSSPTYAAAVEESAGAADGRHDAGRSRAATGLRCDPDAGWQTEPVAEGDDDGVGRRALAVRGHRLTRHRHELDQLALRGSQRCRPDQTEGLS